MSLCTWREGREAPSSQPEIRTCRVGWRRALSACVATTIITSMHVPAGLMLRCIFATLPPPLFMHGCHIFALTSTSPQSVWFAHPQPWPACGPRGGEGRTCLEERSTNQIEGRGSGLGVRREKCTLGRECCGSSVAASPGSSEDKVESSIRCERSTRMCA